MARKSWFLLSLTASLILRLHWNIQGTADDDLLSFALRVIWMAFMLPSGWPVVMVEAHVFHFDPWVGTGHWLVTNVNMIVSAGALWLFPVNRIKRWFGTYDPFEERRRPMLVRGFAHVLDAINKRLFGRQKTGGFA